MEIIPVLNKIDLPAADPDRVAEEIEDTIGLDCTDIVKASAKSGIGIDDILESIVKLVPPPEADIEKPFRALIFDSYYDSYRGVIVFFRVVDGSVKKGDKLRFMASAAEHEVTEGGVMTLWGLGNIILIVVVVPVLVALLSRVLGALERIRGAADDALAGGVALIGELDTAPELLATTDQTIAEVADGAVRYAGSVGKLLG